MPPLNWRLSIKGWPILIVDAVGAILGANALAVGSHLIFKKASALQACEMAVKTYLIRFFLCHLPLYRNCAEADNASHPGTPVDSLFFGGLMTKMALFLFGFLVLTIGIGLLATISPV